MARSGDDLGIEIPSIPTGGPPGVRGLLAALNGATIEVRNLVLNECDIMMECSTCRNVFRSLVNFVTHKRVYCRTLHDAIAPALNAALLDFAQAAVSGGSGAEEGSRGASSSVQQQMCLEAAGPGPSGMKNDSQQQQQKRAKGILKRTNLVGVLNKRTEHYAFSLPNSEHKLELFTLPRIVRDVPTTTMRDGQQVMETFPHTLLTKDKIPSDRVPVVIPQDNSSRYREMNLRNRKNDSSKNGVARTVGMNEIEILERIGKYQAAALVDLSTLTCLHSDCKEKLPFSSFSTLAYHLTVKHNRRATPTKQIPCYLCDFESQTYAALVEHLKEQHEQYYLEHAASRVAAEELKRGRKGKQAKVVTLAVRGRSLSPLSDDFVETEDSAEVSDENGSDTAAPILEVMVATTFESEAAELKLNGKKGKKNGKEETKTKPGGDDANKKGDAEKDKPVINLTNMSEIEWAVKNRIDFMVATVSGDADAAQILEDKKYDLDTRDLVNTSSKPQARPKGRPRAGNGKSAVQPKASLVSIKKKKHGPPVWLHAVRRISVARIPNTDPSKEEAAQETDEDVKMDIEVEAAPKKRGRGRKPKAKVVENPVKIEADKEDSGNSDEAEDGRRQRPSRHRRKPNWIDENFVTGFRSKRARREDDDAVEYEKSMRPPSSTGSKGGAKSADSSQRSSPVDSTDTKAASSEGTSNSSTPGRQQSPYTAGTSCHGPDDSAARTPATVLPPTDIARDAASKKTCRFQYTPNARRMRYGDDLAPNGEGKPSTSAKGANGPTVSGANGDGRSTTQSRRKQDLSTIRENNDDLRVIQHLNGEASLPKDLSEIPVYLTETQRDLFFSFIRPASPSTDGATSAHKCMQCGDIIANISEGRRHAVSHLRIMRLRCSLCDCGSFFCSDMRTHLQYRHCENLHLAPKGYVAPGDIVPCMTQRQADDLTKVVDPMKPGRVMYTSGKIISSTNPKPYYPDPVIERRVLGTLLPEINVDEGGESTSTTTPISSVGQH